MRPLIGITSFPREADLLGVAQLNDTVPIAYTSSVRRAGGAPLLVPVSDTEHLPRLLGALDGLVLTGGGDVDPSRYGAAADADRTDPRRDAFDEAVVHHALEAGLPVLAICRGLQVLNVALGGTLHLDLPGHRCVPEAKGSAHHVEVEAGTVLAEVAGAGELAVNSLHHQAVDRLADGLRVTAVAPDGVVEGVEVEDGHKVHGVQWHPELLRDREAHLGLFVRLIEDALGR